jgi:gentisate 1,2-dioxygenase
MSYIKAYEYQSSVNPFLKEIEIVSKNYKDFGNGINFINMSNIYNTKYKATTPNLLSGFIRLNSQQNLFYDICDDNDNNINDTENFNASSHFFYVIEGNVKITFNNINSFTASSGDIIVSPRINKMEIIANLESTIYYVNDSPLLNYIGVVPNKDMFQACCYTNDFIIEKLNLLSHHNSNRKGILLGNEDTEKNGTRTITHTLWTLYNELPKQTNQRVHKHNSVAIDYCVYSPDETKVYTLIGDKLDEYGNIINPEKIYWKTGTMFITPPGLWHSHHNETNNDAYVLPIQDAGLLIYQRILGIVLY